MASVSQSRARTRVSVADAIAARVAAAGIELAFVFPGGGSNLALIEALRRAGVEVVLTRSETGAAFMAATYGELTGRPGVLVTGAGPGAASAVNGVAHAFLDRAPLVVVTDRYSPAEAATSGHQLLDHESLLAPVTKWRWTVEPHAVAAMVAQAVELAAAPPAGPVHLDLQRDRALDEVTGDGLPTATTAVPAVAAPLDLATAAEALGRARRPVVLVGHEARGVHQGDLVRTVEALRAPTLSTYKAKGVFPEEHPLSAGIVTGAEIERPFLERADVFLGVGFDPIELLARPWGYEAPICALRADPAPDPYLAPRWSASGNLAVALAAVADSLAATRSGWTATEVQALKRGLLEALRIRADAGPAGWEVVEAVQAETPPDVTVTVDAGAHMFAATWFWRSTRPTRFLISNGLATMGYAVPAAVAASLVRDETVIAFTGDGGLLLNGNELETAARTGARVVVVALNDAGLGLIRVKQEELGYERAGVDFLRSDLTLFARALGVHGVRATTAGEVGAAVRAALTRSESTLIDVRLSGSENRAVHRLIRG
jgi:acetolactate synthase-1/2/3 large subunit